MVFALSIKKLIENRLQNSINTDHILGFAVIKSDIDQIYRNWCNFV
jgi:hypothetical protein